MNNCNFCGSPVKGNEKFCTSCGAAIAPSPNQINAQTVQTVQPAQQVPGAQPAAQGKTNGTAIGGFVCGLVGLLILPLPLGIVALSLSATALSHFKVFPNDKGKGLAIAGIVMGVIDVAWAVFSIINLLNK